MKTPTQKLELAIRQFVRTNFKARVAKVDGAYQSEVNKKGGAVVITNPKSVLENLMAVCGKPVAEKGKSTTFKMKNVGTITMILGGDHGATLKLINNA